MVIPPGVSQVRLEARIEIDYPRYEAVLQTIESKRIWSQGDLTAEPFSGGQKGSPGAVEQLVAARRLHSDLARVANLW